VASKLHSGAEKNSTDLIVDHPWKQCNVVMAQIGLFGKKNMKRTALYWVNYNDLTATSLESWLIREIIPKWP